MKSSVKVGDILGIPVEIHYSWIVVFFLVTWSLGTDLHNRFPSQLLMANWIASVICAFSLLLSILVHELSHSYFAKKFGLPIKKITMYLFGGVAHMEREPETAKSELIIAIAGPAFSFIVALFSFNLFYFLLFFGANPLVIAIAEYLFVINLSLAIFNLLPGFPLDGGRILRAILWQFMNDLKGATKISTMLGKAFSLVFIFIGLFYIFKGMWLNGIWLLVIGIFLHEAADASFQQLMLKKALRGIPVRDIMETNVVTVPPDIFLNTLISDYFLKHKHLGFPVVENGFLKGIVTLSNVKEIPNDLWETTNVAKAMTAAREDLIIDPNKDAMEALLQVTKSGLGRILVVEHGKLLGLVVQRDLLHIFEIKSSLCT